MELFKLEGTRRTPGVTLDPSGEFTFKGRSITEDPRKLFDPVLKWVSEYMKTPSPETVVNIQLEYFNSGSAKSILEILQMLVSLQKENKRLQINWYYEEGDDDILERGEYYASILDTNFNFIEYE